MRWQRSYEVDEKQKPDTSKEDNNHMANERTYLAWVRTSIAIMAFGFVVERFTIFIKQFATYFGKSAKIDLPPIHDGYAPEFGILLVALGVLFSLLAFFNFKKVQRQINNHSYHSASWLPITLTLIILASGIFLVVYLIQS